MRLIFLRDYFLPITNLFCATWCLLLVRKLRRAHREEKQRIAAMARLGSEGEQARDALIEKGMVLTAMIHAVPNACPRCGLEFTPPPPTLQA